MKVHFKVIGAHGLYANGEGHSIFFKELLYLQQCVKLSPEQCPRLFKYKLGYFAMRRLYGSKIFSWLQIIILSVTRKRIFISIFLYMVINMYSTLKLMIGMTTIRKVFSQPNTNKERAITFYQCLRRYREFSKYTKMLQLSFWGNTWNILFASLNNPCDGQMWYFSINDNISLLTPIIHRVWWENEYFVGSKLFRIWKTKHIHTSFYLSITSVFCSQ